jgi:hypothetical protein
LNTVFNILSQNIDTSQSRLFIGLSLEGVTLVTLTNNTFNGVVCIRFKDDVTIKSVASATQEVINAQSLLKENFKKIDIIYAFPDSILVPYELMNESVNKEMMDFVYGDSMEETIKRDFLYKHSLYNVYRIPSNVYSLMNGTFPSAIQSHLYSVLPDVLKAEKQNHLYGIFGSSTIIVLLKKEGKLQVIQNFKYKTPEDAAYHLLNVCRSFEATVNETTLHVSGMLDKVSVLYTELYKYFLNIEFESLPENFNYTDEIKEYPPHFFSHLFAIAACV